MWCGVAVRQAWLWRRLCGNNLCMLLLSGLNVVDDCLVCGGIVGGFLKAMLEKMW